MRIKINIASYGPLATHFLLLAALFASLAIMDREGSFVPLELRAPLYALIAATLHAFGLLPAISGLYRAALQPATVLSAVFSGLHWMASYGVDEISKVSWVGTLAALLFLVSTAIVITAGLGLVPLPDNSQSSNDETQP